MVVVSIVLGLLSVAGLLLSLLAVIYPFGRYRTRGRALKAAAFCVVTFVLSPIIGAVGAVTQGEIARTERTGLVEAGADPGNVPAQDEAALTVIEEPEAPEEAAAAEAVQPVAASTPTTAMAAPAATADAAAPPAQATPAPAAAEAVAPAANAAPPPAPAEPRAPTLTSYQAEQLLLQAMGEEWDALRVQLERLRERGVDLGATREELEELMLIGVEPIPASEPARNLAGYRALAALKPDDPTYAAKVAQYETAAAQREESLIASLRVEEDRIEGVTRYHHPHEPEYWDQRSLVWLVITERRGRAPQLILHTHYTGDRWLFVHEVKAYHHGYAEVLTQGEFEGDHDTEVWEWRDEVPTEHQRWMLENFATASDATLRFEGQQYHHDVVLSAADKRLILDMLEAYGILSER